MDKILINEILINEISIKNLTIFLDDNGNLIVLPFLWSVHLSNTGSVFRWKKTSKPHNNSRYISRKLTTSEVRLDLEPVSDNTIRNYVGNIFKLLKYINKLHIDSNTPSTHYTELLNSKILNHYLNEELPKELKSFNSLTSHQSAISSYLAFLFDLGIKDITPIVIYRNTKQLMAEIDDRPKKINYISKAERAQLLKACNNNRDKLIIRLGYEVGLRTCENLGLLLRKKNEKDTPQKKGLLNLFFELDHNPSKLSFQYLLDGKYTKRGKSRNIFFSRELLQSMKDYYENERDQIEKRSKIKNDSLLLRFDNCGIGLPIGKNQGTNVFRELRKQFPNMNETLSYHDLRHTFATELYHSQLIDSEGRETRSESAALLTVSQRLGHQDIKTSSIYIRLKQQMLIIEGYEH